MRIIKIKECKVCGYQETAKDSYIEIRCKICGGEMKTIAGEAQATLC